MYQYYYINKQYSPIMYLDKISYFWFPFSAIISEIYHPEELAVARLAESFGASPAKYIDFQQDNSSASLKTGLVSMALMTFLVALL